MKRQILALAIASTLTVPAMAAQEFKAHNERNDSRNDAATYIQTEDYAAIILRAEEWTIRDAYSSAENTADYWTSADANGNLYADTVYTKQGNTFVEGQGELNASPSYLFRNSSEQSVITTDDAQRVSSGRNYVELHLSPGVDGDTGEAVEQWTYWATNELGPKIQYFFSIGESNGDIQAPDEAIGIGGGEFTVYVRANTQDRAFTTISVGTGDKPAARNNLTWCESPNTWTWFSGPFKDVVAECEVAPHRPTTNHLTKVNIAEGTVSPSLSFWGEYAGFEMDSIVLIKDRSNGTKICYPKKTAGEAHVVSSDQLITCEDRTVELSTKITSDAEGEKQLGDVVNYAISVENSSYSFAANNVKVALELPAGMSYNETENCSFDGATVECALGDLARAAKEAIENEETGKKELHVMPAQAQLTLALTVTEAGDKTLSAVASANQPLADDTQARASIVTDVEGEAPTGSTEQPSNTGGESGEATNGGENATGSESTNNGNESQTGGEEANNTAPSNNIDSPAETTPETNTEDGNTGGNGGGGAATWMLLGLLALKRRR